MRAAVFEGPEKMIVREVPLEPCGPGDIIVKVYACGICGSDVRNYFHGLRHGVRSQIMGHELSGTVSEVGRTVKDFKEGDRVALAPDVSCGECYYCKRGWVNLCDNHRMLGTHWPGGFAEYIHIPEVVLKRGIVNRIPAGVSLEEACLSEPASSVIACQERAGISVGDSVMILGDGPVGCLHVEVARANGASRIVMTGLIRLEEAKKFRPDLLLDSAAGDVVAPTRELTGGLGVDVAICANPVVVTQEQAVQSVRKRGRVVLFGGVPSSDPMTSLNSNTIHYNELEVVGAFSYQPRHHLKALDSIKTKALHPRMYFTKTVGLDSIVEGIIAAKAGKALKVLVKP
ncbi:MAG: alcohol dehydrogenase catalytic domain-containing protein [bacterium]|nr:MAG: alcohol dehydrogenase catalytic domain-containing protein [bacterium]